MKKLKTILNSTLVAIALMVTFASCSSDDAPSGTKVRYKVALSSNILTSISFRGADGDLIGVPLNTITTEWGKTIYVDAPFTADLSVGFNNTGEQTQNYTLTIYVDDEIVTEVPGTVSAGITTSAFASHDIE